MSDNYFENLRKNRIKAVQKFLENESPIKYDKAVAEISLEWGVGRDTARGYLKTLQDAGRISINGEDMVTWEGDE